MNTGSTRWSCQRQARHGASISSTAIITSAAARSQQPWPATPPSPSRPATPLNCPSASPSWGALSASLRSSSSPTPSSKPPAPATRRAICRRYNGKNEKRRSVCRAARDTLIFFSRFFLCLRCMGRNEAQHLFPGIGGFIGKLLVAAIEEAMGRAGVDHDFRIEAGLLYALLELLHLLYRNALVSAAEETQQRVPFVRANLYDGSLYGSKCSGQTGIEADYPGKAEIARTRRECQAAAQAEAGDEGGTPRSLALAQVGKRGIYVGKEACFCHLLHMRHVLERLVARAQTGGASKIVDCQRRNAHLGETQRQFLVKLVQPAHIGIDKNLRVTRMLWKGKIGVKAVAIGGHQYQVLTLRRPRAARRCRRNSVVIVTHASYFLSIGKPLLL